MIFDVTTTDALTLISDGTNSIDVRAPIEFKAGTIPLSRNLPLMNDAERALWLAPRSNAKVQTGDRAWLHLVSGGLREQRIKALGRISLPGTRSDIRPGSKRSQSCRVDSAQPGWIYSAFRADLAMRIALVVSSKSK